MPVLGKRPNHFAAPVAKAYRPTMRDQVANVFSRALGDTYQSNELARGLFGSSGLGGGQGNLLGGLGLLDLTPIGAAFALEEAGRQIGGGQPVTGAANVALGMVPIPAVAKGGKAVVRRAARRVAGKAAKAAPAPPVGKIADWNWRPSDEVKRELDLTSIPPHVLAFGQFMDEQAGRAAAGQMGARDLVKAYGITRASMQRSALPLATAEKRGAQLSQLGPGEVRPEGAFAELLGTPEGQAYLDAAQRGQVQPDAIASMMDKFRPFGFQNALGQDLEWAALNLPQHGKRVGDMVAAAREGASDPREWTNFFRQDVKGVDAAKAGFVGSLLGRGDLPTLDARQIVLQTGRPTSEAGKYLSRGGGAGSVEAVQRLAERMNDLGLETPDNLKPYYQHLAHHTVWDKVSGTKTTHADIINAMKRYGVAAPVAAAILAGTMQPPKGKEPGT